ncbi:MLP-like protein 328 [Ziziphus jujuba]|uniref:MLP-like protein 328 n=2 Tax=Ziziphus jujuba TaxID=326968 RepID=A0A6P4B129_ZIZJJ|nr:MLP-like protein 328 [Ziziphus jujuba]KAH7516336.1 hypothetical protein FEM48_Zijuj10G0124200 [Ziziphus jujuba var. spinosa]
MALIGTLEKDIEVQTPADKLYTMFKSQCYHIPNISNNIHAIDVHEGDWEKGGSVKEWKYNIDGNVETFKEKVEVDEENKAVTFIAVGGHILDHYKNYKGTFKFTPKIEGGNNHLVKITLDYEKRKVDDPHPLDKYMEFLVSLVKEVDVHHVLQA